MGRKMIEVKSLYGLTIDDLNLIANKSKSNYTKAVIQAIIMRQNGIDMQTIATTLSKCRTTVISYINAWNNQGPAAIADMRGGNVASSLTDEAVDDVRDVVTNTSPHNFGYEQNRWSATLLSQYIADKYGKKYSKVWITKLLKNLGFTYKRGVYKPTLGDPALQESFKKNDKVTGYN